LELASDLCLLVPALAHWNVQLYSVVGMGSLPLFVLGVAGFLLFGVRALKKEFPDAELSTRENIGVGLFATAVALAIGSPLIWWGGQSVAVATYAAP
jgi:hypothetical protein